MHEDQVPVLTGPRTPADVLAAVAEHGVALLRDGGWRRDSFVALGDALMEPTAYAGGFHRERDVIGDDRTTTTVTRGTRGMPLHREASYAPGSPDLLTFLCVRPAADGGRTTLCDGVALLAALPADVRAAFEQLEIVWENTLPDGEWQRTFGTDDPAAVRSALRQWDPYLRPWESVRVDTSDTGLVTGFGTRCTPPTRFGGVPAFGNSLFISRPGDDEYHDQRLRVRTAAGGPVPAHLLSVAAEVAQRLTVAVPWQAGDVLVVDNSRYLHGRQAFTDTGRSVLVRMGHLHQKETT
ncbi:TauD/TfdA family dioxygenase [Micromonospora echinospora]|uniref:TauD/TfdA family dioxygenase n=1 Tax=Micromonospora echinospora TaxID=1877 RepID=UPI003670C8DC